MKVGKYMGGKSTFEEVGKPRRLASAFYYAVSFVLTATPRSQFVGSASYISLAMALPNRLFLLYSPW